MRLIDADAISYCNYDLDNYHSFRAVEDEEIAEMPTIEAEPVRHGRWINNLEEAWQAFNCSICGESTDDTCMGKPRANYCPNCGAKMDKENDNG